MNFQIKHIAFIIFVLFTGVPLLIAISYAFLYSVGLIGVLSNGFTLEHWIKVLTAKEFFRSLGFSFYIAFMTTIIALCLSMLATVKFGRWFREGQLSFMIYYPLVFPAMIMGFYTFQLLSKSGIISRISYQVGILSDLNRFPDWVNDNLGIGIIFAHVSMATPFLIILFSKLYQSESLNSYKNLADTMGASPKQVIWKVIIPILINRAFPTLILYFIFVMSAYEIPLLLGSQSRQMISVFTIQKLQRFNLQDIPQAYVVSVVYAILVIIGIMTTLNSQRWRT